LANFFLIPKIFVLKDYEEYKK